MALEYAFGGHKEVTGKRAATDVRVQEIEHRLRSRAVPDHDQKIKIAIRPDVSFGRGAKQQDSLRMSQVNDLANDAADGLL